MCERVFQVSPARELASLLRAKLAASIAPAPRHNVAPGGPLWLVRSGAHGRTLEARQWGLVAPYFPSPSYGLQCSNARAESVNTKAAFRAAFRRHRCIIPLDGFYVLADDAVYAFAAADRAPLFVAGLWEDWSHAGQSLATCAIVSTPANASVAPRNRRMPALLAREHHAQWLGEDPLPLSALQELLFEPVAIELAHWPASERVRDPHADGPDLLTR